MYLGIATFLLWVHGRPAGPGVAYFIAVAFLLPVHVDREDFLLDRVQAPGHPALV